jgi:hypothetical protein
MSSSGQYQLCIIYTSYAYLSIDFGQSWSEIYFSSNDLAEACVSSAGQYMAIGTNTNKVYISSDFGATWTTNSFGTAGDFGFRNVQMSANGSQIFAIQKKTLGSIYYSSNI